MNAIEFENVGKQYRLGLVSTGTISHDLNRWWTMHILGKEDPYLKIGETNDRSSKGHSDYVWALKDINFNVEQGDVIGIIGKNGAGKSTLLKLLSRVTAPTTGCIRVRGRIASLLEVGTGFHPEMTGRENIYLNGAIMGMTKQEISRKLDEIVDFSGCERYIDTPVKRYSSGMSVRLGFAVAAHLEPEILVVDEVLAVGDAEFQKKAIGKMQDISHGGGRTVLFVSHNMSSIQTLCNHGIVLEKGSVCYSGTAKECVNYYLNNNIAELKDHATQDNFVRRNGPLRELEFLEVRMLNDVHNMSTTEPIELNLTFKRNVSSISECQFGVLARNEADDLIWANYSPLLTLSPDRDVFKVHLTIPYHNTPKGKFRLNLNISKYDYTAVIRDYDIIYEALAFEVCYVDKEHKKHFSLWPFQKGCSIHESKVSIINEP